MTVYEAIAKVKDRKPNAYSDESLNDFLNDCEAMVQRELMLTVPDEIRNSGSFCEDSLEGRLCEVDIQYARPYSVDGVMERFTDGK